MEFKTAFFKCDWGSQLDTGMGWGTNAMQNHRDRTYKTGLEETTTTRKRYHEILCQSKTTPRLSRIPTRHTRPKRKKKGPRLADGTAGGEGRGVVSVNTALPRCPTAGTYMTTTNHTRPNKKSPTPATKRPNFLSHTPPFTAAAIARARAHISNATSISRRHGACFRAKMGRAAAPPPSYPLLAGPSGPEEKRD